MIKLTIKEAKGGFFDRAAVTKSVDAATRKVLSKAGAFVRRDAKFSIRKARQKALGELTEDERKSFERRVKVWRKDKSRPRPKRPLASSKPGEPPRSVTGLLKQNIYFSYDAKSKSVVIGPAKLNKPGAAPKALEHGGTTQIRGKRKTRMARIAPRPFMQPALAKNAPKIQEMYRDSIKVK